MSQAIRLSFPKRIGAAVPEVSVCIPVFNGANYIAEAVSSVLAQTHTDLELIVSDNCSNDGTGEVVGAFRDPRLHYTRHSENLGLVGNFNRALSLARGEYVCIFHHDDSMLPRNVERKVYLLREYPSVGFVHSNIELIGPDGCPLGTQWNEDPRRDYVDPGLTFFRRFVAHMPIGCLIFPGSVLARRACYEHLGGFRPELPNCNDSEMYLRLSLYYDVACIGTPLVKWRQYPGSVSATTPGFRGVGFLLQHYAATRMVFREHRARIHDRQALLRQARASFAGIAIRFGWMAFHRGDFVEAREYATGALTIYPPVLVDWTFWSLATRLVPGHFARNLYRAARRRLIG